MKLEIKKDIYWVGVVDWNVRTFHGHTYNTNRGTTYNSYLILDDKVTLVDAVLASFSDELINKIKEIVPLEKIDYIIVNHIETDHSGALPKLMKLCPKAKLFGTAKCKEGLFKHYHEEWPFQIVKTGDKLSLGKREFTFIEAPMIHWPDSMFTYCQADKLLLPNDAFGQHYATSERFDDETDHCALVDEAAKYYGNILWPLSGVIAKKLEELFKMNLAIDMIAPSHGIIWRKDPQEIINLYLSWSKNETKKKAVVVYETMWGSTEKMASAITQGLIDSGLEVKLFDITVSDRTEVIKAMLDAKAFVIGSSTHDNDMLTTISGFLEFLKGLSPKNRQAFVFGSFGWAGGAVKHIEEILASTGINILEPGISIKYVPDDNELKKCYDLGKEFAGKVK